MNKTFIKGNLAVARVILDLTQRGFVILNLLSEQLPFDLVAYKNGKFIRFQVKYSCRKKKSGAHEIKNQKYKWYDKSCTQYKKGDFDYFAVYLPEIDKVIYPSIKFGGIMIRSTPPKLNVPCYYYQDFINFTDKASKRKL